MFVLIGYFIFQNSTPSSFSRYVGLVLPFFYELRQFVVERGRGLQQQMIFLDIIVEVSSVRA
jgi:hypothetical protein